MLPLTLRALLAILATSAFVCAEDESSWKFMVMSDMHAFERYAPYPDKSDLSNRQESVLSNIKNTYGGDLIILPGDTQSGKWNVPAWINKHFPGLSAEEAVYKAGMNCYSTMKKVFAKSGYDKILVAIGDHELGDNYWAPNDSKTLSVPEFRRYLPTLCTRTLLENIYSRMASLEQRPLRLMELPLNTHLLLTCTKMSSLLQ